MILSWGQLRIRMLDRLKLEMSQGVGTYGSVLQCLKLLLCYGLP